VLNALLSIINERVFHNDGALVRCPLVSLFAAANDLADLGKKSSSDARAGCSTAATPTPRPLRRSSARRRGLAFFKRFPMA